jgi:integrase
MSKKKVAARKQVHLVFSANTGFQYYLTLPKHLSSDPALPAQIRWSLGRDEALARALARVLDESLAFLIQPGPEILSTALVQQHLEASHTLVRHLLQHAEQIWTLVPSPAQLANEPLDDGHARLIEESRHHPVLFSASAGSEIIFSLAPSQTLQKAMGVTFTRLDWPLGTTDQTLAREAAAYIFSAIGRLENLENEFEAKTSVRHPESHNFTALALHDYLCHARPDRGVRLSQLPAELPSSLAAYGAHYVLQRLTAKKANLGKFCVSQLSDGLYAIELQPCELTRLLPTLQRKKTIVHLPTNSAIVAALLAHRLTPTIERRLYLRLNNDESEDAYESAMREIADLVRRSTGPHLRDDPLGPIPSLSSKDKAHLNSGPRDPATQALASALSGLLPADKRARLEQLLFSSESQAYILPTDTDRPSSITFGELTSRFESEHLKQGSWTRPRTRSMVRARLAAIDEMIGAHRCIDSLTRSDFLSLRDLIRQYPKNRHKIKSARRQSLHKLISEGSHEPINPRTAKKFFELARAIMRFAHDHGLLKENLAAGLTFVTRGAEAPRRRTYDHDQLQRLFDGPVYRLETPPRWRLDDYKFWMPLLGLFTGARLGELCQLRIADVQKDEGVWIISIDDSGTKHLKTLSSRRSIPLHDCLIKAGFLSFVEKRKSSSQNVDAQLFDQIKIYQTLAPSHSASKWYAGADKTHYGYLGQCGLADCSLTFHGLRHSFINQFRRQKLDLQIAKSLVGHADKSTTGGYGDDYPSTVLKEELDKIDFKLQLNHVDFTHYEYLKKLQGNRQIGRPSATS